MCGLFGWQLNSDKISVAQRAIAACILMQENEKRGRESWGWYDGITRYRGVGDITSTDEAVRMAQSDFVLGHTRLATMGKLIVENCHPFKLGHIIGAHNGVVFNAWELDWKFKREFDVDSMHIFQHINDKLPLEDIEAYGAITYVNLKERGRIRLGRFNGGVLSAFRIRDDKGQPIGVMWSSEDYPLRLIRDMTGLNMLPIDMPTNEMFEIWAGEMWKIADSHIDISDQAPQYSKSCGSYQTGTSPYSSAYATAYEKEHEGTQTAWQDFYKNKSWCIDCSSYNSDGVMCFLCDRCFYCCQCVENSRLAANDDRMSYAEVRAWQDNDKKMEGSDPKGHSDGTNTTVATTTSNAVGEGSDEHPKGGNFVVASSGEVRALHLPFSAPLHIL